MSSIADDTTRSPPSSSQSPFVTSVVVTLGGGCELKINGDSGLGGQKPGKAVTVLWETINGSFSNYDSPH
jgi:hypothetical protein